MARRPESNTIAPARAGAWSAAARYWQGSRPVGQVEREPFVIWLLRLRFVVSAGCLGFVTSKFGGVANAPACERSLSPQVETSDFGKQGPALFAAQGTTNGQMGKRDRPGIP